MTCISSKNVQARRRKIYESGGGLCGICKHIVNFEEMTVDHIVPLSRGGSRKQLKNQQAAHYHCNVRKGNKIPNVTSESKRKRYQRVCIRMEYPRRGGV